MTALLEDWGAEWGSKDNEDERCMASSVSRIEPFKIVTGKSGTKQYYDDGSTTVGTFKSILLCTTRHTQRRMCTNNHRCTLFLHISISTKHNNNISFLCFVDAILFPSTQWAIPLLPPPKRPMCQIDSSLTMSPT
jgi:hypothetical protein